MVNKLLSVKEASEYLGVSPTTIYRLKRDGKIPYIQKPGIGIRFRIEDLDKWLEESSYKPLKLIPDLLRNNSILNNLPGCAISGPGGFGELANAKSKTRYNFGYGAIYQRKTKSGKIRWYLDYRKGDGKRIQKVASLATARDEAALALREEVAKTFSREYGVKRQKERIKFSQFAEIYLKNYSMVKKRAWERSDKVYLHANLIPYFGDYEITKIDALLIERFIAKRLEDGVKKSTINRDLACLRKMFNKAIDWDYLTDNPLKRIRLFSENDNLRSRILSEEEEKKLLESSSANLRSIMIVATNGGLRFGEIVNLSWNQIDLRARIIRVEKTKSGKPRFVNINTTLLEELLELGGRNGQSPYVFFNPKTGKPFTTVKTAFKAACRRAGIKGLTFHDLRRTFATRLLQNGVDIETVRSLLGHHSISVTQRYTHSSDEVKKRAVEVLSKKPDERAKKEENPLHIRDTAQREKENKEATYLFSVN